MRYWLSKISCSSSVPAAFNIIIVVVHQLIYAALGPFSRWHLLTYCKVLLGLVGHVSLVINCLVAAGPHHGFVRNWRFKVSVSVSEEAHPETDLVLLLDIGRTHVDGAVARVVVGVNQVLDDIHPAHGAADRQLCPSPGLDGSVESLYHGRLLLALTGKVLDTVALHQGLEIQVEELLAFVGL